MPSFNRQKPEDNFALNYKTHFVESQEPVPMILQSKLSHSSNMDTNRSLELNVGDFFRCQGFEVDATRATYFEIIDGPYIKIKNALS